MNNSGVLISSQEDLQLETTDHFKDYYRDPGYTTILEQIGVIKEYPRIFFEQEGMDLMMPVTLQDDILLWSWNTSDGSITTNLAYLATCSSIPKIGCWWHDQVWKWNIPPRVRVFIWLLLEEKILIWSNLQKRGFTRPSICPLCLNYEESLTHLFILYPFVMTVQSLLGDPFSQHCVDNATSIHNWFYRVFNQGKPLGRLACLYVWEIWKSRNKLLFENISMAASRVSFAIQSSKNDVGFARPMGTCNSDRPSRPLGLPCAGNHACFDGATTTSNGLCGAGAII